MAVVFLLTLLSHVQLLIPVLIPVLLLVLIPVLPLDVPTLVPHLEMAVVLESAVPVSSSY